MISLKRRDTGGIIKRNGESQQRRRVGRPVTREKFLRKKIAEWDKREKRRKQKEENFQLRKRQWFSPKRSRKKQRRAIGKRENVFLFSDKNEIRFGNVFFE